MPPWVDCLRHIAVAAAMVNKLEWNTQNTNKTQLLASNCGTFWSLVVYENFIPRNGPSTQLINATSFVIMWNAMIRAEELAVLSRYQMLSADKKEKKLLSYHEAWFISWRICANRGKAVKKQERLQHTDILFPGLHFPIFYPRTKNTLHCWFLQLTFINTELL
jgi:hypothetical protein